MAENEEVWKNIPSYEGRYQVSTFGNIRSLNYRLTGETKILKPAKDLCGYLFVFLYKDGKGKRWSVHRLVAKVFISNPLNLPIVNHRDENRLNNRADNLEFCTQKYNAHYGMGESRIEAQKKKVRQYDREGKLVAEYGSVKEAVEKTGLAGISAVCRGEQKTTGGYTFSYVEEAPKEYHEPKNRPKRVVQYSLDGTRIAVFQTIYEAHRRTGANKIAISRCCNKNDPSSVTAGGFRWSLEGDEPKPFRPRNAKRPVCQYDREGKLIARYATLKEAAAAVGSNVSNLRKCCNGAPHYNTAKGFRWAFAD